MHEFHGRVALITGAAGNLGAAVCEAFARAGARLALFDINDEALGLVTADLPEETESASFVTNLIDGIQVPLYGDGGNVRDWLHVLDHCRAVDLLIQHGVDGEVYQRVVDAPVGDDEATVARAMVTPPGVKDAVERLQAEVRTDTRGFTGGDGNHRQSFRMQDSPSGFCRRTLPTAS